MEWVKALKELFDQLKAYVKQHHVAGPAWNRNGVPVGQFKLAEGGGATAAAAGVLPRLLHKPYIEMTEESMSGKMSGAQSFPQPCLLGRHVVLVVGNM